MRQSVITILALAALASCTLNEELERGADGEIRIFAEVDGVKTKALMGSDTGLANASFVLQTNVSEPSLNFSGGTVYTGNVAANTGKVTFTNAPVYPDPYLNAYLVAYFPGNALVSDVVEWDIDGKTDILVTNSIWDAGKSTAPNTGSTGTKLIFHHQLSRVEVVLEAESTSLLSEVQDVWGAIQKIEFPDAPMKMRYDLTNGHYPAVSASGAADFALLKDYTGTPFTDMAIPANGNPTVNAVAMLAPVLPTSTASFMLRVTTAGPAGGSPIVAEIPVSLNNTFNPMRAGYTHIVKLTFKTSKKIEITTSTVTNWQMGDGGHHDVDFPDSGATGVSVGDYYYSDETFSSQLEAGKTVKGMVFQVSADGTTCKVMSLIEPMANYMTYANEKGKLLWSTSGFDVGSTGKYADLRNGDSNGNVDALANRNGELNWELIKRWLDDRNYGGNTDGKQITDFPAFIWCADDNNGHGPGWYVPALTELQHIYCAYIGVPATKWANTGGWQGTPGPAPDADKKTAWNKKLTDAGGTGLSDAEYASSTEYSTQSNWWMKMESGTINYMNADAKTRYRHVRCVRNVRLEPAIPLIVEYGQAPYYQTSGAFGTSTPEILTLPAATSSSYLGASVPKYYSDYMDATQGVLHPTNGEPPYRKLQFSLEDEVFGTRMSWENAKNYCNNKSDDGGGWRLPRTSEILLLYFNRASIYAAREDFVPLSGGNWIYWLGTESSADLAWLFDGDGNLVSGDAFNFKTNDYKFRCVREVP